VKFCNTVNLYTKWLGMVFIPTKHTSSSNLPEISPWVFVLGKWVGSENTPLKLQQYDKRKSKFHPITGQKGPEGE